MATLAVVFLPWTEFCKGWRYGWKLSLPGRLQGLLPPPTPVRGNSNCSVQHAGGSFKIMCHIQTYSQATETESYLPVRIFNEEKLVSVIKRLTWVWRHQGTWSVKAGTRRSGKGLMSLSESIFLVSRRILILREWNNTTSEKEVPCDISDQTPIINAFQVQGLYCTCAQ